MSALMTILFLQLSRFLQIEHRLELLPGLDELSYSVTGNDGDTSVEFVEACKNASLLVTHICGRTLPFKAFRWAFDDISSELVIQPSRMVLRRTSFA